MRKRFATLLALVVVAIMAYGAIGSGATFSDQKLAQQTINIGNLAIRVTSTTANAYFDGDTLVCPTVTVLKSTDADPVGCTFKVESLGSITPTKVTLAVSTWTNGADVSKFLLLHSPDFTNWGTSSSGGIWGMPVSGTVDVATGFPATATEFIEWQNLSNDDMGKTVVVKYTFSAVE